MLADAFFDTIETQYREKLPFIAYKKPNTSVLKSLLQKDSELNCVNDYKESGFVFAPFDSNEAAVVIPNSNSETIQCDYVSSFDNGPSQQHTKIHSSEKQFHLKLVQNGISAINANEFQKVVLSRKEEIQLEQTNPIEILKTLLNTYPTAFVYCFFHPKVGLWLGATPETLLQLEGNRLTTMALAGTQKFDGTTEVAWEVKELEEQQFVTDFIIKSLQPVVSNLQTSETETVQAGNLLHLKTTITAILNTKETADLKVILQTLHPTPAVCGLPREKAKQFILKSENYEREFYTGFIGELNLKETTSRNVNRRNVENNAYASVKTVSNLYVNLRCMKLFNNQAYIYVGGGVTKDSNPENEWEETVSKSQVIKRVL